MGGKIILETDRLILREMTPDDLPALCRILCDREVMHAKRVYSMIRDTHTASQRVAERIGMHIIDHAVKHFRGVDMEFCLYCIESKS